MILSVIKTIDIKTVSYFNFSTKIYARYFRDKKKCCFLYAFKNILLQLENHAIYMRTSKSSWIQNLLANIDFTLNDIVPLILVHVAAYNASNWCTSLCVHSWNALCSIHFFYSNTQTCVLMHGCTCTTLNCLLIPRKWYLNKEEMHT